MAGAMLMLVPGMGGGGGGGGKNEAGRADGSRAKMLASAGDDCDFAGLEELAYAGRRPRKGLPSAQRCSSTAALRNYSGSGGSGGSGGIGGGGGSGGSNHLSQLTTIAIGSSSSASESLAVTGEPDHHPRGVTRRAPSHADASGSGCYATEESSTSSLSQSSSLSAAAAAAVAAGSSAHSAPPTPSAHALLHGGATGHATAGTAAAVAAAAAAAFSRGAALSPASSSTTISSSILGPMSSSSNIVTSIRFPSDILATIAAGRSGGTGGINLRRVAAAAAAAGGGNGGAVATPGGDAGKAAREATMDDKRSLEICAAAAGVDISRLASRALVGGVGGGEVLGSNRREARMYGVNSNMIYAPRNVMNSSNKTTNNNNNIGSANHHGSVSGKSNNNNGSSNMVVSLPNGRTHEIVCATGGKRATQSPFQNHQKAGSHQLRQQHQHHHHHHQQQQQQQPPQRTHRQQHHQEEQQRQLLFLQQQQQQQQQQQRQLTHHHQRQTPQHGGSTGSPPAGCVKNHSLRPFGGDQPSPNSLKALAAQQHLHQQLQQQQQGTKSACSCRSGSKSAEPEAVQKQHDALQESAHSGNQAVHDGSEEIHMLRPLKTGYLYRYKKRLLNKDWRREYCVLLSDSSLLWFKEGTDHRSPAGKLFLRDAPQLIAYGPYTNKVPLKPSKLPAGHNEDSMLVFGEVGRTKRGFVVTVHWFLADDPNQTLDWINAIINTLPPPPPPPYSENDEVQRKYESISIDMLMSSDLQLMNIKESSIRKERSPSRSRSMVRSSPSVGSGIAERARSSSRTRKATSDAQEAAMNAALNTGTSTGWGRGPGWSVQGDPTQILCYYAAAEAALVDLSASDLAFDIPADLGDLDLGDSMFGDFGDAVGAMDFGGII